MPVKKPTNKTPAVQAKIPTAQKEPALAVRISQFDKLVYAKDFDAAHKLLIKILTILENSSESFGATLVDVNPLVEKQATIFCAAVTRLLIDQDFVINDARFFGLTALKRPLTQAFEISGYRGTDHLVQLMGTPDGKGGTTLTRQEILRLFIGLSINALSPNLTDMLLRQIPNIAWPLCIGFLSEQIVYSENARSARAKILAASDHLKKATPNFSMVRNLGPAYMGCSYDESIHKHDIKRAMNAVVRSWLGEQGVEDAKLPEERRAVKKRPTLLIIAELYGSMHAMHRCYGPAIRSLKDRFKLVFMAPDGKCDKALHYMFDKIDDTKFTPSNPKLFFDKAKSYRPDIVYYPSVGMRLVSIVGSNLRIAPIQLMTYGHPATTHSNFIDYSVLMEGQVGNEKTISDKILYWPAGPRYEVRSDTKLPSVNIRENPDVVKIAVPAWSRKITPSFLESCKFIQDNATKKVEFYFFPNGVGALFQAFSRRVTSVLEARVLPRTNYNDYLTKLNECDIFLSSFPFGATNGILDAGPLGLPIVNVKGDEVHALNDSEMVSHMNQPEWLSTDNKEGFIKAVLRLIADDGERVRISKSNAAYDYEAGMMVSADSACWPFADSIFAAYKKHEALMTSPQKSFSALQLSSISTETT